MSLVPRNRVGSANAWRGQNLRPKRFGFAGNRHRSRSFAEVFIREVSVQSCRWGAVRADTGWTLATWAPQAEMVQARVGDQLVSMSKSPDGFWSCECDAKAGTQYSLIIDGRPMPDPASRLQSGEVHAPSILLDHTTYKWSEDWAGRDWSEAVLYELHLGTFTPEGTFAAAADKLAYLADLGITAVELMPVGQWSGNRGWGYDGVLPFAPHPAYGSPEDFKRFVERAHGLGLMVILDVVMNHFGPDGAYIHRSAPDFFNPDRHTPWGAAIDFSQEAVRSFWIECALMWLIDYHLDGLRLDAVHQIDGKGADRFFSELGQVISGLDVGRPLHIILEDERNEPHLREKDGFVANWNDDFHHAIHTALTGESHDYYESFAHDPIADLVLALENGHIEQGQERPGLDKPRGMPSAHLPTTAFVNSTQTHDQVGNRPHGDRLISIADEDGVKIAYALLLVSPFVPMIFMGEERGETAPFQFFADYEGDLGQMVRDGRAQEFAGIAALGDAVPDPTALETYHASRIDWCDTERSCTWNTLTRKALIFRAEWVRPLLNSKRLSATAQRVSDRSIKARWRFEAGQLDIGINLGGKGTFADDFRDAQFTLFDLSSDDFALSAKAVFN
jgi:maltooligosyltrehalose trehalohydrolase